MGELKVMSIVRCICLLPIFVVYGAWALLKFTLGLWVLLLLAWLVHNLLGSVGDVLLALPVIYLLSHLVPNPRITDIAKSIRLKTSFRRQPNAGRKAQVVDFKPYRRGAKP